MQLIKEFTNEPVLYTGSTLESITYREAVEQSVLVVAKDHYIALSPILVRIALFDGRTIECLIRTGFSWNGMTKWSSIFKISPMSVLITGIHDFFYYTHLIDKDVIDDWFISHYDGFTKRAIKLALGSRFSQSSWDNQIVQDRKYAAWLLNKSRYAELVSVTNASVE